MKKQQVPDTARADIIESAGNQPGVREAEATGFIHLRPETIRKIKDNKLKQGDVIALAEMAGVEAVKNISSVVPQVQHVSLTKAEVKAYAYPNGIEIKSFMRSVSKTGLETEALTAVCVALLTLFEICKPLDNSLALGDIKLTRKTQE